MVEWELLALIYLLSVCKCWRFFLDLVVVEASLTFTWCTWFSSSFVEMVSSSRLTGFLVKVDLCFHLACYPWCEDGFIFMSWYTLDICLEL